MVNIADANRLTKRVLDLKRERDKLISGLPQDLSYQAYQLRRLTDAGRTTDAQMLRSTLARTRDAVLSKVCRVDRAVEEALADLRRVERGGRR